MRKRLILAGFLIACAPVWAQPPPADTSFGDRMLEEYFRAETAKLAAATLADIESLEEWEAKAKEGREKASALNDRFAPWYYVLTATDFQSIRLSREKLLRPIGGDA